MVDVRAAEEGDLPEILEIHNHAVLHSDFIWVETPDTLQGRADWLSSRRAGGAVLVAHEGPQVLGHGSYGQFRPYDGFRQSVEHSIYVSEAARGRGVGRALLDALITHARTAGRRVMVAAIDGSNPVSLRLHERAGFREVGRMPGIGIKHGNPRDMVLLQLDL